MITTTPTPVSTDTIQREIASIQQQLVGIVMPPLAFLEREVLRLTTATALEPANRADLYAANAALTEARATVARVADLKAQLAALQQQLADSERQKRMEVVALRNQQLKRASDEYLAAGTQLIRAYRRLLEEQKINQRTPGATDVIPAGFDFLPANPEGWTGTTSWMMGYGPLPFESLEAKAA